MGEKTKSSFRLFRSWDSMEKSDPVFYKGMEKVKMKKKGKTYIKDNGNKS